MKNVRRAVVCAVVLVASCGRDQVHADAHADSLAAAARATADSSATATVVVAGANDTITPPNSISFEPNGRPVVPAVFHGTCEGEDCEKRFDAITCAPAVLRAEPNDTARVVERLLPGDSARVVRRDLQLIQPGLVVLQRDLVLDSYNVGDGPKPRSDTLRFAKGDTTFLLRYVELGEWELAHHGYRHTVDEFWAGPWMDEENEGFGSAVRKLDSTTAVAHSQPWTVDWWRVVPRRGAAGWWHASGERGLASVDMLRKDRSTCETLLGAS